MLATDLLADLFFMADVVLNFNTGFIKDQVQFGTSACTAAAVFVFCCHTRSCDIHALMRCPVVVCAIPVLCAVIMPAG